MTDAPDLPTSENHLDEVLADERRVVALDGVHNFRDLGGYPADGGTTRWGLVYRADGLHHLTPDGVDILRARGLAIVIDLRSVFELENRGRFPVDQHAVEFHHLPVLDRAWRPGNVPEFETAHEFLMWAYRDMLVGGADKLAEALRIMAAAGDRPLVFHCTAGKDRTGLLAALLLSLLGVPPNFIAADYGKTAEAMADMMDAWRALNDKSDRPSSTNFDDQSHYFESPASVMAELLAELAQLHGSVANYVRTLGVDDEAIDALRARLIVAD